MNNLFFPIQIITQQRENTENRRFFRFVPIKRFHVHYDLLTREKECEFDIFDETKKCVCFEMIPIIYFCSLSNQTPHKLQGILNSFDCFGKRIESDL